MKEICAVFMLCFGLTVSDPIPEFIHTAEITFEWTGPLSLAVINKITGQQDQMELRPAQRIGNIEVECLFDGFLKKDRDGSGSVLGCHNWPEVNVIVVANISQGTMFTFYSQNKTTVELLEPIDDEEEEGLDRVKRSSYRPDEDDYVDYDENSVAFSGANSAEPLPPNLYYRISASYDAGFLRKLGDKEEAEKYISTVIAFSRPFYKKASLSTNVHFIFDDEIKFLKGQEFKIDPTTDSAGKLTIADAYKIPSSQPLIIFAFTDNTEAWRGVARKRGACDASRGRAIIKWRLAYQRAAKTMAHEQGHLFGKYHDKEEDDLNKRKPDMERTSQEDCFQKGIMSDVKTPIPLRKQDKEFSECSRNRFLKWFTNYGNKCIQKATDCNNAAWSANCACGVDARTSLCTREDGGYCEHATGTCLVKEDKVKLLLEDTLETCSAFTPDSLLSGCQEPEGLEHGHFFCLEDSTTCHVVCDPGYYLEINGMAGHEALKAQRFMKCMVSTWTPLPTTFKCTIDCTYGDNDLNPDCAVSSENSVVLLTGGFTEYDEISSWGKSVEVFSPWEGDSCNKDLGDLPKTIFDHTTHFFKEDIILCGGQHNRDNCIYFDNLQKSFIDHSQLSSSRACHRGAVVDDKILLVGGSMSTDSMDSWDGSQWTNHDDNLDNIKDLRFFTCMAAISEDTVLMAGGKHGGAGNSPVTNKMFKYKDGVWTRMADFPGPARQRHGCSFIETPEGDSFLIAGGYGSEGGQWPYSPLDSAYLYNIGTKQWEEVGKLDTARFNGKVIVVNGRVLMVGGVTKWQDIWNLNVEEYNVATKTWTIIKQKIKRGRQAFDAVVVPKTFVGGC